MKTMFTVLVILFSLAIIKENAVAQLPGDIEPALVQTDTLYRIETTDDNEYVGTITFQDSMLVRINTEKLGEITLKRKDISSMTVVKKGQLVDGDYWSDNPQSSRYMWAPNGYGLKKGEGYYQNIWVVFNQVSVGLTNNFSMGVGTMPTFLLGQSEIPVWLAPKLSIPVAENVNVGLGVLGFSVLGVEDMPWTGLLYGTATFGTTDRNISAGIGYGFVESDIADVPLINVSGMLRVSEKWYLISENYFLDAGSENVFFNLLGGRRMLGKASFDFGIFRTTGMEGMVGLPWIGFTIPFGA
jgi:hypothetical protein